ncbi:MAG: methyltransferase domain-containing protein [Hamadaea sp.]|uniref:methyltransferase domain-containing protein n=1 Tax=Hamadaea sp. TaxID=2024425 RepID=UPI0017DE6BB8|nr:methyltransferase domain-containing protein [Hamadaea sp.]NUR49314.1 methyltransferase domain-containing protein [Hamadaea sp.]NUR74002.1 methyltransferase domain-containing protein [Hamadaea sp.]NUT21199.1 methyltransferase domain-containing protein [Hamadaea sp.]
MGRVSSGTFDEAISAWRQWQDAPWGRLRYAIAANNLGRHLDEALPGGAPGHVLDVAGGNGVEAVRLATAGHKVTLVDYSAQMLAAAAEIARKAGVADRMTIVESDVARLPELLAGLEHDLVLCHNLLPYVTDVEATLRTCLDVLRPGGVLSVIANNAHSEPLRVAVREQDPSAALEALNSPVRMTRTFGAPMTPRTADEVIAVLSKLGARVDGHYGIRSVCDYMADDERKYDASFYAELERLEIALADRLPYKLTARLFHVVAVKPVA